MTELHFLRHADAGDPLAWTAPDARRPLSSKGEKQADRLGRFLVGTAFRPDVFLTSPKVRAAQTAEIVARHLDCRVVVDERLVGGLTIDAVEAILVDAGDPARPVLVGHDPDFTELVEELTGSPALVMRKGAMVRLDADRPLVAGSAQLAWLVPPELLKPAR